LHLLEVCNQLSITLLRRNIRIHQADTKRQRLPLRQIRLDERRPLRRDRLRDPGKSAKINVGLTFILSPAPSCSAKKLIARVRPGVEDV
jgi:hypothetical protein